jgi:hypothetical protein
MIKNHKTDIPVQSRNSNAMKTILVFVGDLFMFIAQYRPDDDISMVVASFFSGRKEGQRRM